MLAAAALVIAASKLVACEEDNPNCPNGPYTFDNEVDRCRDADGRFAVDECC